MSLPDRSTIEQMQASFGKAGQKDTLSDFLAEYFPQSALLRVAKLPQSEILPLMSDPRLGKSVDFVLPSRDALAEALALQPGPPPDSVLKEYRLGGRKKSAAPGPSAPAPGSASKS